ncbi:hypothetical protein GQR36_03875 [Enterococcus termitis]
MLKEGNVISAVTYDTNLGIENFASITFRRFEHPKLTTIINTLSRNLGDNGFFSFDFMFDGENFYPIECNPRLTFGIVLDSERIINGLIAQGNKNTTKTATSYGIKLLWLGKIVTKKDWRNTYPAYLKSKDVLKEAFEWRTWLMLPWVLGTYLFKAQKINVVSPILWSMIFHILLFKRMKRRTSMSEVRLYSKADFSECRLTNHPLYSYIQVFFSQELSELVENSTNGTCYALEVGQKLCLVVVAQFQEGQTYPTSLRAQYLDYAQEELALTGIKGKRLLSGAFQLLKRIVPKTIDEVVYVGNYLLSTNLFQPFTTEELQKIEALLQRRFPTKTIVYRSQNSCLNQQLMENLSALNYQSFISRQVFIAHQSQVIQQKKRLKKIVSWQKIPHSISAQILT